MLSSFKVLSDKTGLRRAGRFPLSLRNVEDWNAQYGAWRVARYAPERSFDRAIELPVSQPTCPAFGGSDLKTLFVTSATKGLDERQLEQQPNAGRVIAIDFEIEGLAGHRATWLPQTE